MTLASITEAELSDSVAAFLQAKRSPPRIHKQRINRVTAGHEQPIAFAPAEAQVRAAFRQRNVPDSLALRVEHAHAVEFFQVGFRVAVAAPAAPQVAGFVALDAVDGGVVQAFDVLAAFAQGAVVFHGNRPDQAIGFGAAFDDVEGFFIRGKAQAVGAAEVVDHAGDLFALAVDAVHGVRLGRGDFVAFVVVAGLEGRVGEPDRSVTFADDVIGRVEGLAVEAVGQHGDRAIGFGAGDAPAFAGGGRAFADDQPALAIAAHAVGEVRVVAVHAEGVGDFVPAHDAVVGDVADQQIAAITDPHRPFGPAHTGGEFFDAGVENPQLHEAVVEDVNQWVGVALTQRFGGIGESAQGATADGGERGGNRQGLFQEAAAGVALRWVKAVRQGGQG